MQRHLRIGHRGAGGQLLHKSAGTDLQVDAAENTGIHLGQQDGIKARHIAKTARIAGNLDMDQVVAVVQLRRIHRQRDRIIIHQIVIEQVIIDPHLDKAVHLPQVQHKLALGELAQVKFLLQQ